MSSCVFDLNKLQSSLVQLKRDVFKRLFLIKKSLQPDEKKFELLKLITEIGESYKIDQDKVDASLEAFQGKSFEELTKEEIRSALVSWKNSPTKELENTSTERLDNIDKNPEKIIDDPLGFAYGRALKAKIRATQHANTVGIHSILYNSDGIINTIEDLNSAIIRQQEELLQNIIKYLNSKGINIEGTMYENGKYTGILEDIERRFGINFRFDFNELNNFYNKNDFKTLDAFSSWVILNNFDTLLKQTFGKAIEIDPDKSKFYPGKYSVAGGSNVYTTWRTNEEIDLSKEVNNISQAIVNSLPYYLADSTSPSNERNLKFNEFVYLITKLKNIPNAINEDYIISPEYLKQLSSEANNFLAGKSLSSVINTLRDNPQKILPYLIEAFNNKDIFNDLSTRLNKDYFSSIDRDLINTIYQGLFNPNNEDSLLNIQNRSGYEDNNYFAFITQTIDSIYKSSFLQYFRDPEGNIYARPMYDQSLYIIEQNLKTNINQANIDLQLSEYNMEDDGNFDITELPISDNYYTINGIQYTVQLRGDKTNRTVKYLNKGVEITDQNIIEKLNEQLKKEYVTPTTISYTYNGYHEGPLKAVVNLTNGSIKYSVNGKEFKGFQFKKDFDSLLPLIENVLKQNFDIDTNYLNAFLNREITQQGVSKYGKATTDLMQLVSRVLTNKYLQDNYIVGTSASDIKNRLNKIFNGESKPAYKPTYNSRIHHLNLLTDSETSILNNLAQAKALVTGKLTSSQILDGEGNALSSSALSRLLNSLLYQVEVQIKQIENSAAKEFSLWKQGVYKGIYQLKEMKDNSKNTSKSHTQFSNKEMENALVFIDFLQGLTTQRSTKSPYANGIVGFYPSENSDKTYVGRILIDLKKLQVGDKNLYELLRKNPSNIKQFWPQIRQELNYFYQKALENIDNEWKRVGDILGIEISYGNWQELENLAQQNGLNTIDFLRQTVSKYNYNNPFNPITLTENVHYVESKNGRLIKNSSFVANLLRLQDDVSFSNFMLEREQDVLQSLLKDGLEVEATPEIEQLLGKEWIDSKTNKVILAKYYDPENENTVANIRRYGDYDSKIPYITLNPLISAYNSLNYFVTQEYMNSSVGAYYAHPNKKGVDVIELLEQGAITEEQAFQMFLNDEKVRKLAQDKRNVSFTAAMHAMQKNLLQGIPETINIAIMPDVKDSFITISGDPYINEIKPYDGATFTNPFYQILQNYSLGGAKVGLIKKTFTHYYDEKTGTGGIIKTAEFPLTNEYIRRSKFYGIMMQNMTDRIWRNQDGTPATVDITTSYTGKPIVFSNPESDQGYMYFQDSETGEYYMFNITKSEKPNTYIRTIQKVDENGIPTQDKPTSEEWVVDTNYKLWQMLGGEYSMSFTRGKFYQSEHSIKQVVDIMNNVTIAGVIVPNAKTQEDVWQPLKHSDIHLMPTSGAVKQGAANVNDISSYSTADSSRINHFRVRMNQVGVQLDKEHHADGEDLSIMTQVLSACAARGYTQEQTQNLYNAMARLAEAGIRPYLKSFEEFFKVSRQSEISDLTGKNINPQQLEQARQKFENTLLNTLIKALANSTNNSATIQIITQELLEKAKKGEEIDFADANIPLSDPSVMRKLHSTISVALTQACIKIKVDGSLNILCPSFGIVKVYNGKMRENFLNDKAIDDEQKLWDANPASNLLSRPSEIKIGRTYKVTDRDGYQKLIHVNTTEDYWKLRDSIAQYTKVQEQFGQFKQYAKNTMIEPSKIASLVNSSRTFKDKIKILQDFGISIDIDFTPRNLEEFVYSRIGGLSKNAIKEHTGFKDEDINKLVGLYSGAQGISVDRLSENIAEELTGTSLETDSNVIRDIILRALSSAQKETDITRYIENNRINEALSNYTGKYNQIEEDIEENPEEIFEGGRELASYNVTFSGNIQIDDAFGDFAAQQITESFNLYDLVSVKNLYELKKSKNYTKQQLDEALTEVQKDLNTLHSKHGQVLTHKGLVEINPKSVNIEPYEIIMPKIFATVFGLDVDDDLNSIKENPNFFTERLLKNLKPTHGNYTICLQRINGKHTYILNADDAVQSEFFRPKQIQTLRENGKLYRYRNGEKMYEIGENDQVWEKIDASGNVTEVIVTNNPLSYIDRIDFVTLNLNRLNSFEQNEKLIEQLSQSENKAVKNYIEIFNEVLERPGETFDNALEDIQEIDTTVGIEDSPVGKWYRKLGNQIYSSFLKSLEVVAARIPAQSMQSFMPMKVVGFERSDRNTAYVSTTQFLFQGSDLDIDAVSLASFAFDKSGRYILHSPFANIDSFAQLKASENIPFPTGIELEINTDEQFDYSQLISYVPEDMEGQGLDQTKPFHMLKGNKVIVNTSTVEAIEALSKFIEYCNKHQYIPSSNNSYYNLAINAIRGHINKHNNYINTSKDVAEFSKNYMVNSMFTIGLSPANLIESQQAMDAITGPLKEAANVTLKAISEQSNDNPADFTTNIHGFVQNMDGKTGVGICAVGLKGFFAATARYNEVLNNGTPEEVERLKSDVTIANKRFQMLANAYTTNEVNQALLGEIITQLDQGKDAALILSGLLSLATDNAKELALSKLNAANMLGMYIYGIAIGMDFRDISKIIASKTGQVIDSLIKEDVINNQNGMNLENIFDYIELGPKIIHSEKIPQSVNLIYSGILSNKFLREIAWGRGLLVGNELILLKDTKYNTLQEAVSDLSKENKQIVTKDNIYEYLENLKKNPGSNNSDTNPFYKGYIEFNNNIEKAQKYISQIADITTDTVVFPDGRTMLYYNGTSVNMGVYGDLKKLYSGGEEMRTLGQLLHINQGNETSYIDAIGYIDKVESAMSSAKYRQYREYSRKAKLNGGEAYDNSGRYNLNFHKFVSNPMYREGCIDLYGGICKYDLFMNSTSYREIFIQARNPQSKDLEKQYKEISEKIKPIKTFFNILDILNVPHYSRYIQSADMLHQLMQNSIKYRSIYKLGKRAIAEIGAYAAKDRENIFKRTEQFVDRLIRDRYFINQNIIFEVPVGNGIFVKENNGNIKSDIVKDSPAIIKLGTREGNASFKKLMEDTIIPQLKKMDRFKDNKFIQSLDFTLFSANPEQQITRCYAPNINMSPRSDVDSALFEEVKHDFNKLRTSDYVYFSGNRGYSLIDLFYYYNLISFGGRVGENTLTNIFQDVLDYRTIKNYRNYESEQDKYSDFDLVDNGGTITIDTLRRETAPRANELSTKLQYFYSEDYRTGELSFVTRNNLSKKVDIDGDTYQQSKFDYSPVSFTTDEDAKNYLVQSTDTDVVQAHFHTDTGQLVTILIEKGSITDINVDGVSITIPATDLHFFRNLKMISRITPEGVLEKYYDKKQIISKINEIVSCKL